MNINITPDQFLMIYRFVNTNPTSEAKEVKNKMDIVIHDALTSLEEAKANDKFPQWLKKEQEKISVLTDELKSMKDASLSSIDKHEPDDGLYYRKP